MFSYPALMIEPRRWTRLPRRAAPMVADDPLTRDFQRTLDFFYQPEVYLLDGAGNVLMKWVGYTSEAVFAQYLQ